MKPTFLVILAALTSLSALADGIAPGVKFEHEAWQDRTIVLETMKLDPAAHELTMKTDEGLQLSVSCVKRSPRIYNPFRELYALRTLKVGDTTHECIALSEDYTGLDECMTKLGMIADSFRDRPSYMVFNNIPSDVGMGCRDRTDYVKQELQREGK
jgi:hypothetical protein